MVSTRCAAVCMCHIPSVDVICSGGCLADTYSPPFFFFSSTWTTLSAGTPFSTPVCSSIISRISPLTSPCTTISSWPCGFLVTEAPVANFCANSFAAFLRSTPSAQYQYEGHIIPSCTGMEVRRRERTERFDPVHGGNKFAFIALYSFNRHLHRMLDQNVTTIAPMSLLVTTVRMER